MRRALMLGALGFLAAGCATRVVVAPSGQEVYLVNSKEAEGGIMAKHVHYLLALVPTMSYHGFLNETEFMAPDANNTAKTISKMNAREVYVVTQQSVQDIVVAIVESIIPFLPAVVGTPHTLEVHKVK